LISGVAPSIEILIAARVVKGAGAATKMSLSMAFVGEVVPPDRTGRAMGLLGTMSAVGTTLGPALGGLLIAWLGIRAIFLINVPLAAAAMLIAARRLPKDPPRPAPGSSRFDFAGTGLLAIGLMGYALAMTLGRGHFGLLNVAMLTAAFAASIGFVAVERRVSSPLIRMQLFRDRALVAGLFSSMIVSTVMMATLIVGPFYLAKVMGLGAASAGLILAVGPLVAALAGVPAGGLVDRFGTRRATCGGLATLAAGAAALSAVPPTFGIGGYLAPIVIMTAGYGLFQAANNTAIMSGTGPAEHGVVSGMINLSRNLGLATGASAMGAVFTCGTGTPDIMTAGSKAVAAGMHATFAVAAALVTLSLLIALRTAPSEPGLDVLETA
jgi:MFS family permease